jgi:ferredoxin
MPAAVDKEKCTGCESCVEACPAEAISMDGDGKAVVDVSTCTDCGVCVDECPVEAIALKD